MGKFIIEKKDYLQHKEGEEIINIISKAKFDSFNEDILGLGKIETKSTQINALSVLFDLEGFTIFCKQIDPQLAVPEYLSDFLKWLFEQIRKELIETTYSDGYSTYSELPLLSKFMGDGILFIWDTDELDETEIMNIVWSMLEICRKYKSDFLKLISKKIVSAPSKLRCGIARGTIYSVGNGNDFVGPCINMSARLQKLNSLTFAFSRRGLNPEIEGSTYSPQFVTKKTDIRGIGSEELVCILKSEHEELSKEDQVRFIDP
jgi:hypothetical protein